MATLHTKNHIDENTVVSTAAVVAATDIIMIHDSQNLKDIYNNKYIEDVLARHTQFLLYLYSGLLSAFVEFLRTKTIAAIFIDFYPRLVDGWISQMGMSSIIVKIAKSNPVDFRIAHQWQPKMVFIVSRFAIWQL